MLSPSLHAPVAPPPAARLEPEESPYENRVLRALPADVTRRLEPHLSRVALTADVASASRLAVDGFVYFPERCVLSLMSVADDGGTVAAGMISRDGVVDVASALAPGIGSLQLVVHFPGDAQRIAADAFDAVASSSPALQAALLRNARRFALHVAQTATCGALHTVQERCIRTLLMIRSRVGSDAFAVTQETLAAMVGARRPGVSVVMQTLHDSGWVAYRRGKIEIVDAAGLGAAACGCVASLTALGAT